MSERVTMREGKWVPTLWLNQCFNDATLHKSRLCGAVVERPTHTLTHHACDVLPTCAEKLLKLRGMMKTEAGRRMAEGRHRTMEKYLADFYAEWDGAQ